MFFPGHWQWLLSLCINSAMWPLTNWDVWYTTLWQCLWQILQSKQPALPRGWAGTPKCALGNHQTPPRCLFSWSEPAGDDKVDHSHRSQLLLQSIHVLPAQSTCGGECWTCTRREKPLISRKEWAEPTEHLKPEHLGQRQHPHPLQRNKWGTGAVEQPNQPSSRAAWLLPFSSRTELAVKGIKGPNQQENLTIPASRGFPFCLAGVVWEGTMLGRVAGCISCALACHREQKVTVNTEWEAARRKMKIYKITGKFFMSTCYISVKACCTMQRPFMFGFFSFINSDVDHYNILLAVVITADKRHKPETSMDASNTWLHGVPNQFSVVWAYLEQNKRNLWETKCSRGWDAGW